MTGRGVFGAMMMSVSLLIVMAIAGLLVLQACRLNIPLLAHVNRCTPPTVLTAQERLAAVDMETTLLRQSIFALERELAAMQCAALPYDPDAPLYDRGWFDRDIGMLYGCWDLASTYRTRDVDTRKIVSYPVWQMCFDAEGRGTQIMRGDDGTVCQGTVTAEFAGAAIRIIEPGNLQCSDGGYIHRRDITCTQADGGKAFCATIQPETNGQMDVGFSRAARRQQ